MMSDHVDPLREVLRSTLEAELLRAVREHYDWQNRARFGGRLAGAVLALADAETRLGRWIPATRTIELSRTLVFERPWLEITSVLEHEMAHQYVHEVLGVRDETAHGESFHRVCAERGIDARAAGPVVASSAAEVDRALDRIRKLLALAGSPNQHEAEVAMQKAHELMLRYNIEAAAARAERDFEVRHLGDPARRRTRVEDETAGLLSELFFVRVIRVPVYLPSLAIHGRVYEIVGTRANVEMASHVYAFLIATAERLWRENRGDARVRSGRDRLSYQTGVVRGFRDKLLAERTQLRGTGLVWVGDRKLDAFYRARHPHITTRRGSYRASHALAAGREAGRTVVLHKPIEHGPSGSGGRLLRG